MTFVLFNLNVNTTQKMAPLLVTSARILLALPFLLFGFNKLLLFANTPPPSDPTAQVFLGTMFGSYLVKLVAFTEIGAAGLLLFARTAFLGALILLPVTVNIVAFHLAHDMPGNGIWIFTTLLHGVVIASQKHKSLSLFNS
jgi:uncharacterized membrane protein YphA (DoxX/SURF4 family)